MSMNSAIDQFWTLLHEAQAVLKGGQLAPIPPRPQSGAIQDPKQWEQTLTKFRDRLEIGTDYPKPWGTAQPKVAILSPAPLSPEEKAALFTWFENEKVGWKADQTLWINSLAPFAPANPPYRDFYLACFALLRPQIILCLGKETASALLHVPLSLERLRGTIYDFGPSKLLVSHHPGAILASAQEPALNKALKLQVWQDVQRIVGMVKYG